MESAVKKRSGQTHVRQVNASEASPALLPRLGRHAYENEHTKKEEGCEDSDYGEVGQKVQPLRPESGHGCGGGKHAQQAARRCRKNLVEIVSHEREEHRNSGDKLQAEDDRDEGCTPCSSRSSTNSKNRNKGARERRRSMCYIDEASGKCQVLASAKAAKCREQM